MIVNTSSLQCTYCGAKSGYLHRHSCQSASPVQGAASAISRSTAAEGQWMGDAATSSASGAKGAADSAKQRYDRHVAGCEEEISPLERLRFFCSLAMSGQDWLDSEAFFDAALADRSPAVQPTGEVARLDIDERDEAHLYLTGNVQLEPGSYALVLSTPAPEQEAAQVAPPGAQEVHLFRWKFQATWQDIGKAAMVALMEGESASSYEFRTLYTAPVPATTPAEQPDPIRALQADARQEKLEDFVRAAQANQSHVAPPFAAPAGQHDAGDVE